MEALLALNSTLATGTLTAAVAATTVTSITTTTAAATAATTFTAPLLVTSLTHTAAAISKNYAKSIKNNEFSPVTLAAEWSRMARLLVLAGLSVVGSIGNVFMISSVMIEDHLKKAGKYHHSISTICFSHLVYFLFFLVYTHVYISTQRICERTFNYNSFSTLFCFQ